MYGALSPALPSTHNESCLVYTLSDLFCWHENNTLFSITNFKISRNIFPIYGVLSHPQFERHDESYLRVT